MRCLSCNKALNDSESTRRVVSTGEFLDMCNKCYKDIKDMVPTIHREDLNEEEEMNEDDFIEEEDGDPYDEGAAEFIDKMFTKNVKEEE